MGIKKVRQSLTLEFMLTKPLLVVLIVSRTIFQLTFFVSGIMIDYVRCFLGRCESLTSPTGFFSVTNPWRL